MNPFTLDGVTVLPGAEAGRYPHGNSLLVRGASETILIDPSLTLARSEAPPTGVDRILVSHAHEDHLAGAVHYPDVPITAHVNDVAGLRSLEGLMAIFGYEGALASAWSREVLDRFHFLPRPDATAFDDGHVFDAGGARIRVVHLPGHTSGHCGFLIEPHGILFLADVDLTGFGPYYGDASSSLVDFERTLQRCREIDARWFVTFHHKGVVDGRSAFLALLADYEAVIDRRETALMGFLTEPRTLDHIVAHRFVYRPHVALPFVDAVERRSAELHLARLLGRGLVREVEAGCFVAAG